MRVVVGEIGWPTSGGTATDTNNARIHNQNLVNLARGGTPLKPNWGIQSYIFSMFDEKTVTKLSSNCAQQSGPVEEYN